MGSICFLALLGGFIADKQPYMRRWGSRLGLLTFRLALRSALHHLPPIRGVRSLLGGGSLSHLGWVLGGSRWPHRRSRGSRGGSRRMTGRRTGGRSRGRVLRSGSPHQLLHRVVHLPKFCSQKLQSVFNLDHLLSESRGRSRVLPTGLDPLL